MAFKFVIFAAFVAAANAGLLGAPVATTYSAGLAPLAPAPLLRSGPFISAAPTFAQAPVFRSGPVISAAPALAPAPLLRSAPLISAAPAPVLRSYAAPLAPVAAPLAYSTPVATVAKVAAPLAVAKTVVQEEYDPNPQYSFGYEVQDALTGDSKGQVETRNGDLVQGAYAVADPDGTRRIVEYTADPINGFNAVVHKEPLAAKAVVAAPAVAKIAAPVAYAAPAIAKVAAPIASPLAYSTSVFH
ncbi:larval cuticle protein A3A [Aethina tumida]|uniref:larval cuticle protein A3A n=1 Tax=Aethina tumida TaxID=116153 RepID=UPI00096B30FB|nr:larval cuticle protein A3A [Aethina tumida]